MPRITAYIPAYNHELFVGAAIESVLAQSFSDLELLVCDDASTDATLRVIETFSDPRIRVLKNATNLGAAWSARRCLAQAKGEFIAPLSSDDAWHPGKLRRQLEILEARPELAVAFSPPRFVDETGEPLETPPPAFESLFAIRNRSRADWLRRFFEKGNCLCLPSALIRASALESAGGFDPRFEQLPDFDLWVRVAGRSELHILNDPLLDFRLHSDGANLSAPKPAIGARVTIEFSRILRHFLNAEGMAALGIDEKFPALERLSVARRAWEIGTDYHRLFAIETVLDTDLGGLPDEETERFLSQSRQWLSQAADIWVGGRHKYASEKQKRKQDREKTSELEARLKKHNGRGFRRRLASLLPNQRRRSPEEHEPGEDS